MKSLILLTVLATSVFASVDNSLQAYRVEILYPRGFRVIVPYTPQYQRIYIHANINQEITYDKTAEIIEELQQQGSGPWIYQNTDVIVSPGDTINYYFVEILTDGTAHLDSTHYYRITKETPRYFYQSTNKGSSGSISNGHSIRQTVDTHTSNYESASQKTDYVYSKDETEIKAEKIVAEGVSTDTITGNSGGDAEKGNTGQREVSASTDHGDH